VPHPLIAVVLPTCTGCGACVAPCGPRAITLESEQPGGFGAKLAVVDLERCTGCGDCVPACPHEALVMRPRPSPTIP
jgi:electron transport complex protein RnfB